MAVYSSPTIGTFRSNSRPTESNSVLARFSGDLYAHSSLRGTDLEKIVGELKGWGDGRIAGSTKVPFEAIEHELKKTPLSMVLSFIWTLHLCGYR